MKFRGKSDFEGETLQLPAKTFFIGLHQILAKKYFNFSSSFNFGDGITSSSLKYFCIPNAFGQGCKSVPLAKFCNLRANLEPVKVIKKGSSFV